MRKKPNIWLTQSPTPKSPGSSIFRNAVLGSIKDGQVFYRWAVKQSDFMAGSLAKDDLVLFYDARQDLVWGYSTVKDIGLNEEESLKLFGYDTSIGERKISYKAFEIEQIKPLKYSFNSLLDEAKIRVGLKRGWYGYRITSLFSNSTNKKPTVEVWLSNNKPSSKIDYWNKSRFLNALQSNRSPHDFYKKLFLNAEAFLSTIEFEKSQIIEPEVKSDFISNFKSSEEEFIKVYNTSLSEGIEWSNVEFLCQEKRDYHYIHRFSRDNEDFHFESDLINLRMQRIYFMANQLIWYMIIVSGKVDDQFYVLEARRPLKYDYQYRDRFHNKLEAWDKFE